MENWIGHYQQLLDTSQRQQFVATLVRHYTEVFDATHSGFLLLDRQLKILSYNRMAEVLFGFLPHLGDSMPRPGDLFEWERSGDNDTHDRMLQRAFNEGRPLNYVQALRRNGQQYWLRMTAIPVSLITDEAQLLMVIEDISAEQRLKQDVAQQLHALEQARTRDALTGLFNRRYILEKLSRFNELAKRSAYRFCIVLIDLDHFKTVNDTYGHYVADIVLRTLAELVTRELRDVDVSARYGEEELMTLMPDTGINAAISILDRVRQRFSETRIPGIKRSLTLSAGIIEWQPGLSLEQLMFRTDQRLTTAKYAGRNQVCGDI